MPSHFSRHFCPPEPILKLVSVLFLLIRFPHSALIISSALSAFFPPAIDSNVKLPCTARALSQRHVQDEEILNEEEPKILSLFPNQQDDSLHESLRLSVRSPAQKFSKSSTSRSNLFDQSSGKKKQIIQQLFQSPHAKEQILAQEKVQFLEQALRQAQEQVFALQKQLAQKDSQLNHRETEIQQIQTLSVANSHNLF